MTTIKPTDNQRAVLQAAGRSANLVAWPVPRKLGLNPGSATIVVKGLLKRGLLSERPVLGEEAVWKEDEGGRRLTLVITKTGMAAVGMLPALEDSEGPVESPVAADADGEQTLSPENAPAPGHAATTTGKAPRPGTKLATSVWHIRALKHRRYRP